MTTTSSSRGIALVTGAADRIGAVLANRLAAEGFAVVVHHRDSDDNAAALVAAIHSAGGSAAAVRADFTARSERAGLIAAAAEIFGPLSVLVNNASVFERDSIADVDEALWDSHFAVHAEAPVFLARDFAAQLPPGTEGNIVNIIDERVLHLSPAYLSYTLSKATLWAATQTLAQSLAPRIRVNAIGPGPTLPHKRQTEAQFRATSARTPLGRGTMPGEVADALMFLLNAPSITGQMLALDGGRHIEWPERSGPTPRQ
ncbi:MAG TPA: SDR family oxidoreductase [Devosiaceae bacterium]|nr:SDR family oxidoreductase [Devosiaceae bacterium]